MCRPRNGQVGCLLVICLGLITSVVSAGENGDNQVESTKKRSRERQQRVNDVVRLAFAAEHDGWSADEVVLQDELNRAFLKRCHEQLPDVKPLDLNWSLLNLRKAGKLNVPTTRRRNDRHDEYLHAAEIAARFAQDKFSTTIDRVMCDPEQRAVFDETAHKIAPEVDAYRLRKAAFSLRKTRRLQPELVVRVADWGKRILSIPAAELAKSPVKIPEQPGVYLFHDASGYLYIGESSNLRERVSKHLDHSDRKSLAHYLWSKGLDGVTVELHAFEPDSQARDKTARRAYESELIRSRTPRLNLAP